MQSQTESVLGVFDSRERVHAASSADAKCGICAQLELLHPFELHLPTIEAICLRMSSDLEHTNNAAGHHLAHKMAML